MLNRDYRNTSQFLALLFGFLMVLGVLVLVGFMLTINRNETLKNRAIGRVNQYYSRVNVCLTSEPALKQSDSYIKSCYDTVQRQTGITADRYGAAAKKPN